MVNRNQTLIAYTTNRLYRLDATISPAKHTPAEDPTYPILRPCSIMRGSAGVSGLAASSLTPGRVIMMWEQFNGSCMTCSFLRQRWGQRTVCRGSFQYAAHQLTRQTTKARQICGWSANVVLEPNACIRIPHTLLCA